MSSIDEIIDHLLAGNLASGEAMAVVAETKEALRLVHEKLQDAQNHVAASMGSANIESLNSAYRIFYGAKLAVEHCITGLTPVADNIAQAQEITSDYIGRLQS